MLAACPLPTPRGTPVRIQRIAEHLGRRGHEVHVFTYGLAAPGPLADVVVHRTGRVAVYRGDAPGPTWSKLLLLDPLLALLFARVARRVRFDVIHAHHAEGLLAALPARVLARVPIVYDVHTLLGVELPFYPSLLPRRALVATGAFLDRVLPRAADRVIAVSEEIRASLHAHPSGRVPETFVIPNGVEPEFLERGDRAARPAADDAPMLAYAGNLAAFQGIEQLLRAFALARRELPALRLRLLTRSDFAPYEALARELGVRAAIDLEDCPLAELPARLAGAHVAVNPREQCSGVPQKLFNYMAAGCPIVSFAGSAKHVEDGVSALVVADGDVAALAQAVLRLLRDRDLATRLAHTARATAGAQFSWSGTAARIEAVYAGLVPERA